MCVCVCTPASPPLRRQQEPHRQHPPPPTLLPPHQVVIDFFNARLDAVQAGAAVFEDLETDEAAFVIRADTAAMDDLDDDAGSGGVR